MPTTLPMPTKVVGDVFTTTLWNSNLRDNINKLLSTGHRVLTVAQFNALTGLEGTKGTVAPDEVYLEVDAANGIQWHLAYESGETTYKWRCIGGPPMSSFVATAETTTSSTYVDLTTVGPSITLPRGGDYEVVWGAQVAMNGVAGDQGFAAVKKGAAATADADSTVFGSTNTSAANTAYVQRDHVFTAAAASDVYKLQYRCTAAGNMSFAKRFISVKPTRLV